MYSSVYIHLKCIHSTLDYGQHIRTHIHTYTHTHICSAPTSTNIHAYTHTHIHMKSEKTGSPEGPNKARSPVRSTGQASVWKERISPLTARYACMCVCMCLCVYVYMYVYLYLYGGIRISVYVCMICAKYLVHACVRFYI